jgi:DNA-binding CsgD family transcriptional regulator
MARKALGEETYMPAWTAGHSDPGAVVTALLGRREVAAATDASAEAPGVMLSSREREVLRLLVAGRSDKEIGAALGLGRRAAAYHVAAVRAKLGAPSRTAAAAIAVRDRLI